MKKIISFVCIVLPLIGLAQKNVFDKGTVYYTLGSDTTIIQSFEYNNHKFKTTFIQFTGTITKCEAEGLLDVNGDLLQVNSVNYTIDNGDWKLTTKGENKFTGDSSVYIATNAQGAIVNRRSFAGIGILANGMDIASFYVFPYMGFYAPQKSGDSLFHRQLSFNGFRKYLIGRVNKNEIRIGSNLMGYMTAFINEDGSLQKIEGVGSSLNIRASIDRKNIDVNILDMIAKRRNAVGAATVRTLRDTARVVLNNTTIEIDYWKPHKRGRDIFGNVVPWNRVWRTGANNATQFRISNDITIGGKKLSKGVYGIWSYLTETQWNLIINKNATAWGTDHDQSADIFRVPYKVEKINSAPVEILKISFIKKDDKTAAMLVEWDIYKASVEISIE